LDSGGLVFAKPWEQVKTHRLADSDCSRTIGNLYAMEQVTHTLDGSHGAQATSFVELGDGSGQHQ
jgi:hypothetical protein